MASQLKLSKDAARVNEYFQEWCDVILDVDKQINKQAQADLIEAQWDTIPFQILHSNQFENLLKLGKTHPTLLKFISTVGIYFDILFRF